jgi:hypothetical protein
MLVLIHRGESEFERVGCAVWDEEDWNKMEPNSNI